MENVSADFIINNNNPIEAEYTIEPTESFDCSFELYATGAIWGQIAGELSNQTDLQDALDLKADKTELTSAVNELSGDISDLTLTVSDNYTELDGKITNNNTAITSIQNTINTYGDIVTYDATDFATSNQGALADTALQPNDNISELVNNVGYITGITSTDVTTALGYIPYSNANPNGYQANVIEAIKRNGTTLTITNKAVDIAVPTTASDVGALPDTTTIDDLTTTAQQNALNSGATTTNIGQIATNTSDIAIINGKIPSQASSSNQLADKNFVNSSISTNTANFIGTFNSVAELEAYSGIVTNNDYAFVVGVDSEGNTVYDRYKYTTATTPASWVFEYELNNSSFTAQQWASINSGITSNDVTLIGTALQPNDNITQLNNNAGYITSTALNGYATENWVTNQGYITGITSGDVTSALGYSPVNPSSLATVATSGSYNDLLNKPTIPTVNDGALTIQVNGSDVATFTANQSGNTTANIVVPDSATWGNITGTLANQTDLQYALDEKQDLLTAGTDLEIIDVPESSSTVTGTDSLTLNGAKPGVLASLIAYGQLTKTGTTSMTTPATLTCNNGVLGSDANGNLTVTGTTETIEDELGNTATVRNLYNFGTYRDSQNIITGKVTRQLRAITFTGEENFSLAKTGNVYRYQYTISSYQARQDGSSQRGSLISTHFNSIHSSVSQTVGGAFTYAKNYIYFIPDQTLTTVALFKQWLAGQYQNGTPVVVVYPLLDASTSTVTAQPLYTQKGDNTIEITQASLSDLTLSATYTIAKTSTINFTNDTGYITSADLPTNNVTTDTAQDISGKKTFLGEKAIYFKQEATSNKLGFTLYNPSNTELGAFEYRPSTIGANALLNINTSYSNACYVGFRYWGTAVNIIAPKVATAGDYYIPTHITNGNTTVTASNTGTVNISTFLSDFVTNSSLATTLSDYTLSASLSTVATSGSYNDLTNKPTIPAAQVQADWNETNTSSKAYIQNKPTIPSGVIVDQTYDGTSANAQSGVAINGAGFIQNTATGSDDAITIYGTANNQQSAINIGKGSEVSKGYSIAIGYNAKIQSNYTTGCIQLGTGTIETSQATPIFSVGSSYGNYTLLNLQNGIIPDTRISSNIARTSQIPTVPTNISSFTNDSGYITGITSSDVTTALGYTPYNATNPSGYISGINSSDIITALGYTPYADTNPDGYITGINSADVENALGYTPYDANNPDGYITGITSSDVTTALGYTPYNSSNPNGYTSNVGTVTSVNNVAPVSGNVALSIPSKISNLTDDTATYPVDKADTLTGLTATITELNYTDGVTSSIQTQLDGKATSTLSNVTAQSVANAIGYTPANLNLSNLTTTGKLVIDGQWVEQHAELSSSASAGSYNLTSALSAKLPNDTYSYEILINITANSTGSSQMTITSGIITSTEWNLWLSSNSRSASNMFIIPVNSARTLTQTNSGSNFSGAHVYLLGYRRIGTNS